MIAKLLSLGRAYWIPALIAVVVATHGAVGAYSYSKGHKTASLKAAEKINEALAKQLDAERKLFAAQNKIAAKESRRRNTIENQIDALPDSGADCNSDVWLHEFNGPISTVNSNTGEPD